MNQLTLLAKEKPESEDYRQNSDYDHQYFVYRHILFFASFKDRHHFLYGFFGLSLFYRINYTGI